MLIKRWTTYNIKHKDFKEYLCLLARSKSSPWSLGMFALFEVFLLKLGISSENVNCIEPYLFLLENEKKMTAAIYTIKIRIFFADMLQSCGTSVTFILVIHHQLQIKRYGAFKCTRPVYPCPYSVCFQQQLKMFNGIVMNGSVFRRKPDGCPEE